MISRKTHWREELTETLPTEIPINQGSISADGAVVNWIAGIVRSQYLGLLREGVRLKVMDRIDLRAKWPIGELQHFVQGQPVLATIPAEAVKLEAGIFRRSKQRWNRWIGRIVLIEQVDGGVVYTVKVHREEWTLKSVGPVFGAEQPSKPWDVVNVVVDPQTVDVSIDRSYVMRRTGGRTSP